MTKTSIKVGSKRHPGKENFHNLNNKDAEINVIELCYNGTETERKTEILVWFDNEKLDEEFGTKYFFL